MALLTAPVGAARLGIRVLTLPPRVAANLTFVIYEEMLDAAERAELVAPPDPPPAQLRSEPGRGREAG